MFHKVMKLPLDSFYPTHCLSVWLDNYPDDSWGNATFTWKRLNCPISLFIVSKGAGSFDFSCLEILPGKESISTAQFGRNLLLPICAVCFFFFLEQSGSVFGAICFHERWLVMPVVDRYAKTCVVSWFNTINLFTYTVENKGSVLRICCCKKEKCHSLLSFPVLIKFWQFVAPPKTVWESVHVIRIRKNSLKVWMTSINENRIAHIIPFSAQDMVQFVTNCPEGRASYSWAFVESCLLWLGIFQFFPQNCSCLMASGVGMVGHFRHLQCNKYCRKKNVSDKSYSVLHVCGTEQTRRFACRASTPLVWLLVCWHHRSNIRRWCG